MESSNLDRLNVALELGNGNPRIVLDRHSYEIHGTMTWGAWSCEYWGSTIQDVLEGIQGLIEKDRPWRSSYGRTEG